MTPDNFRPEADSSPLMKMDLEDSSVVVSAGSAESDKAEKCLNTTHLIQAIRRQPAIWDRSSKEYRDKTAKTMAWGEIVTELYPGVTCTKKGWKMSMIHQLTKRWCNVRDAYVKCRKRKNQSRIKPYVYTDMLNFLDPIYNIAADGEADKSRLAEKASPDEGHAEANYYEDAIGNEQVINEEYLDLYMNDAEEASEAKRLKIDPLEDNVVMVLANLLEKEEDDDRAFFKSIIPTVKALPGDAKIEFRIKVMKLLRDLKKKKRVKVEVSNDDSDSD